jgi:hypothetical protein
LNEKVASKSGLKNWPQKLDRERPVRIVPCESAHAHRIERKMPESQSRLDPNPGFG